VALTDLAPEEMAAVEEYLKIVLGMSRG